MAGNVHGPGSGLPLWGLALAAALIPLLTIHLTYLVSAMEGHVPWCMPYLESCTSISRTGRHGTAYFIFKGTMLPAAILGMLFWWLNPHWLRQLGATPGRLGWITLLGVTACLALVLYTLVLGHVGDGFRLLRRTGVVLYFSLTYLAQLLLSQALSGAPGWRRRGQGLLTLCVVTLSVAMLTVVLQVVAYDFYQGIEDSFEWIIALLVNAHALWVAVLWRRSRFSASIQVDHDG
ncbi:hypothetical protein [Marinobacter zhejiangensis]|uniref:Frag1/DRAM/Sfk1 family protein n=1 Tax=Marinobacter zhejiangensis TaxID=488535 RepID=A0A1I4KWY2_9GAMM|nr:hypothetical protein [Marinobacter zhejiangensis]SFL83106.1 hypothetical protein SAMN04487963_0125 [Marinobacter zhejiangensis]